MCVSELLTVKDKCSPLLVESLLAVSALVLETMCSIDYSIQSVPITINWMPIGINFANIVMGIITVTVNDDFNVSHLLLNLSDVFPERFKRDKHVVCSIYRLIISHLIENGSFSAESFHCVIEFLNSNFLLICPILDSRFSFTVCLCLEPFSRSYCKNGCNECAIL